MKPKLRNSKSGFSAILCALGVFALIGFTGCATAPAPARYTGPMCHGQPLVNLHETAVLGTMERDIHGRFLKPSYVTFGCYWCSVPTPEQPMGHKVLLSGLRLDPPDESQPK